MKRLAIGTILASNYLARARVLAHSLEKHHPDLPFYALIADSEINPGIDNSQPFRPVSLLDLGIDNLRSQLFRYDCKEFLASIKATFLRYLLDEGFDSALFLDPDMLVTASLDKTFEQVESHAMTLSPHLSTVGTNDNRRKREKTILMAGIYNGGFVGISDHSESRAFLDWWESRLHRYCKVKLREGIHYDQRWLDFAPCFIEDIHIIHDLGINRAYWNLGDTDCGLAGDQPDVAESPCQLFHFSGYDPDHPSQASRYMPSLKIEHVEPFMRLFLSYKDMLIEMGHEEAKRISWPWCKFSNGARIKPSHREFYQELEAKSVCFEDPFDTQCAHSFYGMLRGRAYFLFVFRKTLRTYIYEALELAGKWRRGKIG